MQLVARDKVGSVRVILGSVLKQILGDLFRVDDDDIFSQEARIDQVACMDVRLNEQHRIGTSWHLPYVFAHSAYVTHGEPASMPLTVPTHGKPGGPGGSG